MMICCQPKNFENHIAQHDLKFIQFSYTKSVTLEQMYEKYFKKLWIVTKVVEITNSINKKHDLSLKLLTLYGKCLQMS